MQSDCRIIEMKHNLRRTKLHRVNQTPISLEAVLVIKTMYEPQSNSEKEDNPSILTITFHQGEARLFLYHEHHSYLNGEMNYAEISQLEN